MKVWKMITAAGLTIMLLPGCAMNTGARRGRAGRSEYLL